MKEIEEKKLKPCPFCGAEAFFWIIMENMWKVSCSKDCVTMPPRFDMGFSSEDEAMKHWNNQILPSSLKTTQLELKQADQLREIRDGQFEELKVENDRLNRVYNLELERVNKVENKHFQALLELAKEKEKIRDIEDRIAGIEASIPIDPKHPDCIIVLKSGFDAFLTLSRQRAEKAEHLAKVWEEIKIAEKKILIKEVKDHTQTKDRLQKLVEAITPLLNSINRVTAPHRHGSIVVKKRLDLLSNRQIEFEKVLEEVKGEK
jgi:hypothetical protein